MATETELKLAIDPMHARQLPRHPLLQAMTQGKPRRRKLYSIYFDTPELDLLRAGVALRLRRVSGRWVQTVKGGGSAAGGLHQRDEWEWPVRGDAPEPAPGSNAGLAALLTPELLARLRPLFVTEFWRTAWQLHTAQGAEIELALDQGEVRAGERHHPISEVELELGRGDAASLFEVALSILEQAPLRIEDTSKAQYGYLLASGKALPPRTARSVVLSPELPAVQAFRHIAGECLAQLQGNVAGLGQDPECLHQARVAARRLRSALSLFRAVLPDADAGVADELRWLMGCLGPARDWDVFVTQTLPPIAEQLPDNPALAQLRDAAARSREAHLETAREAVMSQRYNRLALTIGLRLARLEHASDGTVRLGEFAAQTLGRQHKRLCRKGRHHAAFGPPERHALRIAAKKLRYAAEFLAGIYPGERTRPYVIALAALQDVLGAMNDNIVCHRLLAELNDKGEAPESAAGIVYGWTAFANRRRLRQLRRAWRILTRQEVFWK